MIAPNELAALKQRMIVAADAAYRIASTSDPFVMHDQEQYERVLGSLLALKSDCRRVLAELDILRGMFAEKLSSFFMEGGVNADTGSVARAVVGDVPSQAVEPSGEAARQDDAGPAVGVPKKRTPRKRANRSKSRGDTAGDSNDPVELGRSDGASEVDRVTNS